MICRILFIIFVLSMKVIGKTCAQTEFSEGTLVYRIDTVQRLDPYPSSHRATQFKLFKKGNLIRVETVTINKFDSADTTKTIEIRNQKGIYTMVEQKRSILIDSLLNKLSIPKDTLSKLQSLFSDFAVFSSYEEEKLERSTAVLRGRKPYMAKKAGQKSTLLAMATKKMVMISPDKRDSMEVQVTQDINAPVGLFFEPLLKIKGTPLQFTDSRYGWRYRYTIESVTPQSLPDELFQIDPKRRVLPSKQLLQETNDLIK